MRIKAEYKERVVTISGTFINISKTLGEMNQSELKQLERLGYPLEALCEPKKKANKEYKAVKEDKPTQEDGE